MLRIEEIPTTLSYSAGASHFLWMGRARVPGGWLVVIRELQSDRQMAGDGVGIGVGTAVTFYPDPGHAWDGSSPA